MAPKPKAQAEKISVDKTFGMKNKNKSKQVQKYIKQITQTMGVGSKADEAERKAKDDKKAALASQKVMNSLFNLQTSTKGKAYDPIAKKSAKEAEDNAIASGKKVKEEIRKLIIEGIANTIRLTNPKGVRMSELGGHAIIQALKDKYPDTFKVISLLLFIKACTVFWVDDDVSTNPMLRCQEDVDGENASDDRAIEDILDERRRNLPPGGTPVTELSFRAWKEKKEAERQALVDQKVAHAKKGGAKALALLSGRDLFTYDASLFIDEDGAASDYEDRVSTDQDSDDDTVKNKKGVAKEADSDSDSDAEVAPAKGSGAAASSGGVAINKDLFLDGGDDLPDDLDDLDDDDE